MDRAHVRSGSVMSFYNGERGKVILENGNVVTPIVIGYQFGNDKILPTRKVINGDSSWPISSKSIDVQADEVIITFNYREKTTQEIEGEKDELANNSLGREEFKMLKLAFGGLWAAYQVRVPGGTVNDFAQELQAAADSIPNNKFKQWIKSVLN